MDSEGSHHAPFVPPGPPPLLWHITAAVAASFSLLLMQVTSLATALLLPTPRCCHCPAAANAATAALPPPPPPQGLNPVACIKGSGKNHLVSGFSFTFFSYSREIYIFFSAFNFNHICKNFQFEADSTYLSKFSFLLYLVHIQICNRKKIFLPECIFFLQFIKRCILTSFW